MKILLFFKPCLFVVFFCISGSLTAQNNLASAGSMTADGASVARNINIPTDLHTGRLNVQIPLYMVSSRNFSIPISLEYQTSGIKVDDMTSWVGKGWTLQCGGMVTRIVRGYPDETGYCDGDLNLIESGIDLGKGTPNYKKVEEWNNKKMDGEPDIFYFQIPGGSGLFVCDKDGIPHTIPNQQVGIEWIDKRYFRITDENGNIFTLGETDFQRETTRYKLAGESAFKEPYVSTWYLGKVENVNHVPIASFVYESSGMHTIESSNMLYRFQMDKSNWPVFSKSENKVVTYEISSSYLTSIVWDTGKLSFYSEYALYSELHRRLCFITVDDLNKNYNIVFKYYHPGSYLKNIELSMGEKKMPICSFVYNDTVLPERNSYSVDYWGYYNGAADTPDDYPSFDFRGRNYGSKTHRNSDIAYGRAGILEKISFPKGGFYTFEYEGHCGYTRSGTNYQQIGGLRIAKVTESAGDSSPAKVTRYEYVKDDGKSSGIYNDQIKLCTGNIYFFENSSVRYTHDMYFFSKNQYVQRDVSGTYVGYSQAKEIAADGSYKVSRFTSCWMNYDKPGESAICNSRFWGFEADNTGIVPASSYFWQRGLINSQKQYSAAGELISTTEYDYEVVPDTKIPSYMTFAENNTWFLGYYYWDTGSIKLTNLRQYGKYIPRTETQFEYNGIGKISKVQKTFPDNTTQTTLYRYPVDYLSVDVSLEKNPIPQMLKRHVVVPIEVLSMKNGRIVSGTIRDYKLTTVFDSLKLYYFRTLNLNLPKTETESYFVFSQLLQGKLVFDSRYECAEIACEYDTKDNLVLAQQNPCENYICTCYGYNRSLPVAVAEIPCLQDDSKLHFGSEIGKGGSIGRTVPSLLRTEQFYYNSFEPFPLPDEDAGCSGKAKTGNWVREQDLTINTSWMKVGKYDLSYWYLDAETWQKHSETVEIKSDSQSITIAASAARPIDEVRLFPQGASVRTTSYLPGAGKISETDENGITTYYEYNVFGILSAVYNNDHVLLEKYEYDKFQND